MDLAQTFWVFGLFLHNFSETSEGKPGNQLAFVKEVLGIRIIVDAEIR